MNVRLKRPNEFKNVYTIFEQICYIDVPLAFASLWLSAAVLTSFT